MGATQAVDRWASRESRRERYDVYGVTLETDFPFATPGPHTDAGVDVGFTFDEVPGSPLDLHERGLVDAQGRRNDRRADFSFYRFDDHDAIRITGAADFAITDDRLACRLVDPQHRYLVEIALFGMVFALWLERRGIPTLHASAAVLGDQVVAFLGNKGGGKTSLAAASLAAGHAFLADDLLAFDVVDDRILARRGWPSLRLWPDQLGHFVNTSWGDLPLVHPDYAKRRVVVGDQGLGQFATGCGHLTRIYLPERLSDGSARVSIRRLSPHEAMMSLVRHSFLPREVQRFGLQPRRLQTFADLMEMVPVSVLRYPAGLERLDEAVAAVERDL